ncbi:hypothetical protein RLN18_07110 [Streptococcus pneumoniae]|nr:hypothetical protein [Streptococcus pneumoniae]
MYNDGVKLIEVRGEGDSPRISLWFDKQLRDVFISLISLSFCKEKIRNKRAKNFAYLLVVSQGVKEGYYCSYLLDK